MSLTKKEWETTLINVPGNLPVVLTVPHDGTTTNIGEIKLPRLPESRPRDLYVATLAQRIIDHTIEKENLNPYLLCQGIHRSYVTPEIKEFFDEETIKTLEILKENNSFNNEPVLIDLHGFTAQPKFGEYDLILGTGYKSTIRNSNLDTEFAHFMSEKGYRVYLPESEPRNGEKYTACDPTKLAQIASQAGFISLQVEIARHLRSKEDENPTEQLASAIGDYLLTKNIP